MIADLDEERWAMIEMALTTYQLTSDRQRLGAIRCIVDSRKPLTASDIARTLELATQLDWKRS